MSDTPKTDAKAQFFGWNPEEGEEFVQADFARELERENAALREIVDLAFRIPHMTDAEIVELIRNCHAAKKEKP